MTIDPAAAVAAIAAANDVESLEKAIEAASFLDATPGDDRQKLRGEMRDEWPGHCVSGRSCSDATTPARWCANLCQILSRCAAGRSRLRRMKAELASKGGAASATARPVVKSPHAKEVRGRAWGDESPELARTDRIGADPPPC